MIEIVGIRFKTVSKVYYFDPNGIQFKKGDGAIVETARGVEYGDVLLSNREVAEDDVVQPLKKVLRKATEKDIEQVQHYRSKEKSALETCNKKVLEHGLDMKLIEAEYSFDGSKLLFYFTADGRVDFRDLVKDLASTFRTRIELRQIGVRDEAKMVGGLGICGRPLCCSTFLSDFQPVSIKMAKEQGISLSSAKISGTCSRLMCCLKYEENVYHELAAVTPCVGALVETPKGKGTVLSTQLLRGKVRVQLGNGPDAETDDFTTEEIKILRNRKLRAEEREAEQNKETPNS